MFIWNFSTSLISIANHTNRPNHFQSTKRLLFTFQVHAILKALPQNQSDDKKDIEKEPSKDEADTKNDKSKPEKADKAADSKKSDTTKDETKK